MKRLGTFSLRRRRFRGDMIEVFKTINGIDKVNPRKLFCIDRNGRTRKYRLSLKIRKHVNTNIRLNFFSLGELLIIGTTFQM